MTAKNMGRPSKYRPEFVEQAKKLGKLGATDLEIADFFGIRVRTLFNWKNEHEEFFHALNESKAIPDERVERSLYHRAIGYEHTEVDIRVIDKRIVKTKIRKYYPPDTTACIFWLKNRQPSNWRAAPEQEDDETAPTPVKVEITVKDARIRPDESDA